MPDVFFFFQSSVEHETTNVLSSGDYIPTTVQIQWKKHSIWLDKRRQINIISSNIHFCAVANFEIVSGAFEN